MQRASRAAQLLRAAWLRPQPAAAPQQPWRPRAAAGRRQQWRGLAGDAQAAAAEGAGRVKPGGKDIEYQSPARQTFGRVMGLVLPVSMGGVLAWGFLAPDDDVAAKSPHQVPSRGETVVNWSGTHSVQPKAFYSPESEEDVKAIVADCHAKGRKLRVTGSALSPNGASFGDDGMMSMALLDKVLWVDEGTGQVRVQAGARVQSVADALKPHGLTLANFASIREQQIGGFTQVSAHGTGAGIPPVDEQVVSLRLVTPGKGVLDLSADNDPALFRLARVSLGLLGVVTEVTLQAVPLARLVEKTFTATREEVAKNHAKWLRSNRHLRYMWLPYTDTVVVVQVNPAASDRAANAAAEEARRGAEAAAAAAAAAAAGGGGGEGGDAAAAMRALLAAAVGPDKAAGAAGLTAFELRDVLLALAPLDRGWVARVNAAEAEYWKRSAGVRVGHPDEILGFDCGGQQWVLEVAFPVGSLSKIGGWGGGTPKDIAYMRDLLAELEAAGVAAPCPIEQRWSAASSSPLSPAAATKGAAPDEVHSWVGVIMYLPSDDEAQRAEITKAFKQYGALVEEKLMPRYGASWHWAKIEPPSPDDGAGDAAGRLDRMRAALAARFPLERLRAARRELDPKNVLGSGMFDSLLGAP
ncbi:L-galactono-1,4-lactone dehydrogenase [Raphidocelis subcapitata]|uniref:L-galactono-1,4-lactone dehydrogenase n=1 Tax=Raphidocelis subcapitata TaxID=307507 RepID=A0A2V0PQA4_9CHLO|nr:L-galactono-1,4-lactone dehydrogenase [Raphidocelis subcapitata]|eukprot:GBF99677.1 L-galactono-1,4-lactone dehydrogenase [Raphidocelis subcapitata]